MLRYFFCQAEDGIRDLVRSRGLGDVYKRQEHDRHPCNLVAARIAIDAPEICLRAHRLEVAVQALSLIHI